MRSDFQTCYETRLNNEGAGDAVTATDAADGKENDDDEGDGDEDPLNPGEGLSGNELGAVGEVLKLSACGIKESKLTETEQR